jgi:phage tail-like protein
MDEQIPHSGSLEPPPSQYLDLLPAVLREAGANQRVPNTVLNGLLLAFETVLSGRGKPDSPGLEELLDGIRSAGRVLLAGSERYFIPGPDLPETGRAPAEFLDWLAGWVALSMREDWTADEKRRMIGKVATLYRARGTASGLRELLGAYLKLTPTSIDKEPISITETDMPPHFFKVNIKLGLAANENQRLDRVRAIVRAIIDQEKPAHTWYRLELHGVGTMQITDRLQINVNTMIGSS